MSATVQTAQQRQKRSILGAFVGTAIEWYDFFSFGTAAALVFSTVFYPDLALGSGLLASFATFWVGFLARPIGGLVFSHFGDRFGRKNTLIVTLLMMGIATTCIGLLPTYGQIGLAAPVLLVVLRAIQGLAVGGEWGGAVVLATENSASNKRGLAGAWVQQGSPAGSILSTVAFMLVGLLPDEQFLSWGWRIPFLFSAVLVIVALLIRTRVEESQEFSEIKAQGETPKVPVVEAFNVAGLFIFFGVMASIVGIASAYFNNTFMLSWTTGILGMDRTVILNLILLAAVIQFFWQPVAAKLSERYGIRAILIWGLVLTLVITPPFFLAIQSKNELFLAITIAINTIGSTAYYAMLATALADAFPARVRYTGVSLAYQLCATIFGGTTPIIAQWLLNSTGNSPWSVMIFYIIQVVLSIIGVIGLYRTRARRQLASESI
ncbi:MFS transporter [Brevibacterium aurantiacum]|uniref:Putative proline/betaine transporter n=1 Tax=Brevibacterium aurantiacum TaxID=273384 RepID=A0A556CAS3_BREAU|nr:MFS transporter [Brevibacterium aurantiacum]TSI14537.1 MHS family MFS transporter [Brevibacterium aurantiacum]